MEQVPERTAEPAFDLGKPAEPPPLKQFFFSSAPTAAAETPPPATAAASLDTIRFDRESKEAFDAAVRDTAATETVTPPVSADQAVPQAASPTLTNLMPASQPPMLEPEYLFQFQQQPGKREPIGPADKISRLPVTTTAYFQQMLSQYEVFPASSDDPAACLTPNPQAAVVIGHLSAKFAAQTLVREDVDRMELALLAVMPEKALPGHSRMLRSRYREEIGGDDSGDKNTAELPAEALRAEMGARLNELQRQRHLLPVINRRRTQLSQIGVSWIAGLCLFGIVAAGVGLVQPVPHEAEPLVLLLAALLSGAVGGFTSLLIKTQQTRPGAAPEYASDLQPKAGSPFILPALGAVSAAVLFFLAAAFLSRSFLSVTLAGTSRLMLCGFAAGLGTGLLPSFRSRPRSPRS